MESRIINKIEIVSIADYGYQVTKNDSVLKPHNASLYGISKVIGNEYSNLICKCIDIDIDTEVKDILAELCIKNQVPIVAYRQGVRYIEELNMVDMDNYPVKKIRIKPDGVYIITGGAGGIGLEIGKYLASIEKINLVFINRSSLPGRSKWPTILEENVNSKLCKQIKYIMDIESEGTKVILYKCDVSSESDMKWVFDDLKKKFSKINGVIHAAGVAGDGFIIRKEKEKFEEVLLPKTLGTWLLDKMTEDQNLDFFINFSSINTLYGIPGQSDYTAANAYLDSFSEYRNRKNKRTMTINWSGWKETGMAFNFKVDDNKSMFKALTTENGIRAFDELLQRDIQKIIIGELNYETIDAFMNHHIISISDNLRSLINKKLNMKKANHQKNTKKRERISEVVIKGKAKNNIKEIDLKLAQIWGKVLGITEVDINDDFYDIGGDSILAIDLLRYLEREFKDFVNIVDIFTYSTIDKMSKYLNTKINKKENVEVKENVKENKDQVLEKISKRFEQPKIYVFNGDNMIFSEPISQNSVASNCYIWGDGKECIVIDPGIDADTILNTVQQVGMNIKYITLTHCHIDHIRSAKKIIEKTGAHFLVPKEDADLLKYIVKSEPVVISRYLKNNDQINIGNLKLKVIHVGGHTKGSICLKSERQLFTGDILFKLSIGNPDKEWGGSYSQIIESIKNQLLILEDEINIYPGHGQATTIGCERKKNPFINLDYTNKDMKTIE
ncbi:SDR family NAD(P)-dependent oxidoreductase (plasmid) [Clostridium estertheticum]|nr:SDR family NAD(P)-dependent oxidoreductase [Clostridium estertheticum]WLC86575.1 SDR family NAD(P)-dependent oxidoreductase [Clostridium estertheticum]